MEDVELFLRWRGVEPLLLLFEPALLLSPGVILAADGAGESGKVGVGGCC